MRVGSNPNKNKEVTPPAEVTVGLLVGIPSLSGYYAQMLDILKLCITSMRTSTNVTFDLMVVDNGSCRAVERFLNHFFEEGMIDILIKNNRNVGRPNGVRQILNSAPGDIIVYSDCDIFFFEKWLETQLELFTAIPGVGLLGGYPVKKLTYRHTSGTLKWVTSTPDVKVMKGDLIERQWSYDFLTSTGSKDPVKDYELWKDFEDIKIACNGVEAFVGASHMSFMTSKNVVKMLPHYRFDKLTGLNDLIIDNWVDEYGLLRVTTSQRVIYHMGNHLNEPWLKDELSRIGRVNKEFFYYIENYVQEPALKLKRYLLNRLQK